jgi:hypothetical protein
MNKTVDREVPKIETVHLTGDYQFLDGFWLITKSDRCSVLNCSLLQCVL